MFFFKTSCGSTPVSSIDQLMVLRYICKMGNSVHELSIELPAKLTSSTASVGTPLDSSIFSKSTSSSFTASINESLKNSWLLFMFDNDFHAFEQTSTVCYVCTPSLLDQARTTRKAIENLFYTPIVIDRLLASFWDEIHIKVPQYSFNLCL